MLVRAHAASGLSNLTRFRPAGHTILPPAHPQLPQTAEARRERLQTKLEELRNQRDKMEEQLKVQYEAEKQRQLEVAARAKERRRGSGGASGAGAAGGGGGGGDEVICVSEFFGSPDGNAPRRSGRSASASLS